MGRLTKKDFDLLNARALASAETVARHYAPQGKLNGREWVALNPTRSDSSARSFSINLDTGLWSDFAVGTTGGDLISYVAYIQRVKQGEAYAQLAQFLGVADIESEPDKTPPPPIKKQTTFTPIFPPPPEAAKSCPVSFQQFGKASQWWDYKSVSGGLLMRVCRFDRTTSSGERAKEYRPIVWGAGLVKGQERTGWHWRQLPDNRPLYGLDKLAATPGAVVVLCEGEKAALAAVALFPECVCMTWSGGSKAIGKTDFAPLQGRCVWFWPDNDKAGIEAAEKLQAVLVAVGVAEYRQVDLGVFAQYSPGENGALNPGGEWPEKADAFDAAAQGWTAQHLAALEAQNALLLPAPGKPIATHTPDTPSTENATSAAHGPAPFGFKVDDAGVWSYDGKAEKYRRICARLDVVAYCRDADDSSDNWGLLVQFKNRDGREKQINFPLELFATDGGAEVTRRLLRAGLEYDAHRESKRRVLEYLQGHNTDKRVGLAKKTGWHGSAFVLPDRVIGETKEPVMYHTDGPSLCKLAERGTLADWRKHVARYCIDNTLPLFAVSAAFSAPLVDLVGSSESLGLHVYGDSSWGKSTLLDMPCSVFGKPADYKKAWRSTDNGMESLAAAHSELLLALDEINQFDSRKLGDVIYMLGNGSGKTRANDRGGSRDDLHRWRLAYLSNGEKTLEQYLGETGKKPTAGQEMRFIELRGTPHQNEADIKTLGVFNHAHGLAGGAALSELLKANMDKYHGTAFPAFLNHLVAALGNGKRNEFVNELVRRVESFRAKQITETASGQVKRAALKFGLVAWAGELATQWGITGWTKGQAMLAAETCFKNWLKARGGDGNFEQKQMLEHVRGQLRKYHESRFKRWDEPEGGTDAVIDSHAPLTAEFWGFRREFQEKCHLEGSTSETVLYIDPGAWKDSICQGFDPQRAARLLCDLGALTPSKKKDGSLGRLDRKERLPKMGKDPVWCYKINFSKLYADEESEDVD
jgi:uncharacterized protein (DUF927 family)